jgi:hypothetical protein
MTEEQLAAVRCYTQADVVEALKIKKTWLKRWVSAGCIPHQRSGDPNGKQQRGVWFTAEDVLKIGRMLPVLMTTRQSKAAVAMNADPARSGAPEQLSEAVVDQWARLGIR